MKGDRCKCGKIIELGYILCNECGAHCEVCDEDMKNHEKN